MEAIALAVAGSIGAVVVALQGSGAFPTCRHMCISDRLSSRGHGPQRCHVVVIND
jgi:hypothetical protein